MRRLAKQSAATPASFRAFHVSLFTKNVEFDTQKIDTSKYTKFTNTIVYNNTEIDSSKETKQLNLCNAINDALKITMQKDEKAVVFGEDVAFGGVFRCTQDLLNLYGKGRHYIIVL